MARMVKWVIYVYVEYDEVTIVVERNRKWKDESSFHPADDVEEMKEYFSELVDMITRDARGLARHG